MPTTSTPGTARQPGRCANAPQLALMMPTFSFFIALLRTPIGSPLWKLPAAMLRPALRCLTRDHFRLRQAGGQLAVDHRQRVARHGAHAAVEDQLHGTIGIDAIDRRDAAPVGDRKRPRLN